MLSVILGAAQSSNPIVPAPGEVIWSVVSFVVLMALLTKVAFPPVRKIMVARTEKIRLDIEGAEQARIDAEQVLSEYRKQLDEARKESGRLIEEARKTAEAIRDDLVAKAHEEAAEIKARADESLRAERDRVVAELKAQIGGLAVDLAGRIIEAEIERSSADPLVERFIAQVGSGTK